MHRIPESFPPPGSLRILLGIGILLGAQGNLVSKATQENPGSKAWRSGPVRYLLTREEEKAFKSLKTPEDRRRFVEEFWDRRDPTPGTPENEFRRRFRERVEEANRAFPNPRGGWSTDQGRILILFGPPDRQQADETTEGTPERIRWEYGPGSPLGRPLTVTFVPEEEGDFRLSNLREVEDLLKARPELLGLGEKPAAPSPPEVAEAAPEPAPVGPQGEEPERKTSSAAERVLDALIDRDVERHEIRFQARWDFFEAEDVTTHSVLTLGVLPPPALPGGAGGRAGELEAFARLLPADPGLGPVDLSGPGGFRQAEELEKAPSGDYRIFQARVSLIPGPYTLYAGVRNTADGRVGTLREPVEVPDFTSPTLSLSSITLANVVEPIGSEPSRQGPEPYTFGRYRIVPRIEPVFGSEEELSFYYQVYNAQRDPVTAKPKLDIEYQFLMKQGTQFRLAASVPKKGQEEEALGFSLSLQGWPSTDYRLRVTVNDRVAGSSTSREVDFKVR